MTDNIELQSHLLDRYLDQLSREPETPTPDELDSEIAGLTYALLARLTPPEPAPAFVEELAGKLATEARALAGATNLQTARTAVADRSLNGRDADALSPIARDRDPEIIALQPRSWRRELLGIAAAIIVLALVAALLAAAFDLHVNPSDNSIPAAQPTPTQRSVVPPVTATPSPTPTPSAASNIASPTASATETAVSTLKVPQSWTTIQNVTHGVEISYPPDWIAPQDQTTMPITFTSWTALAADGDDIPAGGLKVDFGPLPFAIPNGGTTYVPGVDGHPAIAFLDQSLTLGSPNITAPIGSAVQAPHSLIIFYQVGGQTWQLSALSTESLDDGSPARAIVDQIVRTIRHSPRSGS